MLCPWRAAGTIPSATAGLPNTGPNCSGDAETHAHGDGHYDRADEDLDDDPVPFAHFGEALARPLVDPGGLGLVLPVILAGPNLAFWAALQVAFACALHAAGVVGLCQGAARDHGLEIGVEGVEVIVGGGGGRDVGRTAGTNFGGGSEGVCVCRRGRGLVGGLGDGGDGELGALFVYGGRHVAWWSGRPCGLRRLDMCCRSKDMPGVGLV